MQLKIVTHGGTFRYNQSGQPITEITEPFVLVEVYTKEDVVALYDQGQEHLANAFTYQDEQITGMSADAGDHIQNFFLAEGAWYLQELNSADKDAKTPTLNNTQSSCSAQDPGGVIQVGGDPHDQPVLPHNPEWRRAHQRGA